MLEARTLVEESEHRMALSDPREDIQRQSERKKGRMRLKNNQTKNNRAF